MEVAALIFVDAWLPPPAGDASLASEGFLEWIHLLVREGVDARTTSYQASMSDCDTPDDPAVAAVMKERARLSLAYFLERVPMPKGWNHKPCAYLGLSGGEYNKSVARARKYGWPVASIRGAQHLSIATDPEAVTTVLLELAAEICLPDPADRKLASGRRARPPVAACLRA